MRSLRKHEILDEQFLIDVSTGLKAVTVEENVAACFSVANARKLLNSGVPAMGEANGGPGRTRTCDLTVMSGQL